MCERLMRFARHCWRSRHELVSDVLLRTPKHGRSSGRQANTFVDQTEEDTECEVEELTNLMDKRDEWKKRVNECRTSSTL